MVPGGTTVGVDLAFLMMASSDGSLPVIWPITSALAIRTQSSYFWWRHHWAAATGSPNMVPAAAPAGAANPSVIAPATAARVRILASLKLFIGLVLFSFRRCGLDVEKRFRW